jgi:hypothetical protein
MAFAFFTRPGEAVEHSEPHHPPEHPSPRHSAPHESAWDRLKRLAGDDDL